MSRLLRILTSFPVRLLVTIALLGALATSIDWRRFFDRLEQGEWQLFALGVVVVFVALLIGGLRWHVFLRAADVRTTVPQTLRAYGIGMFANNFLPTGFGGDAARALIIGRAASSTARAVASVVVDRVTALACLVLLAWVCVVLAHDDVPGSLVAVLGIATAAAVAAAGVLALAVHRGRDTFLRVLRRPVAEVWATMGGRANARSVVALTTILGLLYQGMMVLATWIVARSVDLDVTFALLAVVTPLVLAMTLFPISIAGFGVREGAYVALLAEAGVAAPDATLLSLLSVAALAIATLPGAVALLLPAVTRHDPQRPEPQPGP